MIIKSVETLREFARIKAFATLVSNDPPAVAPLPYPGKPWVLTRTGMSVFLDDPDPATINIVDLAVGLSRAGRFCGQTRGRHAYAVAQHSVLGLWFERFFEDPGEETARRYLVHDGHEAYTGDITRPMKVSLGSDRLRYIESAVTDAIHVRFGIGGGDAFWVKGIDDRMLATERRDLMPADIYPWQLKAVPYPWKIDPWTPQEAALIYVNEARLLGLANWDDVETVASLIHSAGGA